LEVLLNNLPVFFTVDQKTSNMPLIVKEVNPYQPKTYWLFRENNAVRQPGLPDFSWYKIPKRENIYPFTENYLYQMSKIYNKSPYNGLSVHKICQHLTLQDPSKIYPNLDFWFKNKPSGNPVGNGTETDAAN
jgi:hypothetical protein